MGVMVVLLGVSLVIALCFLGAFIWSVRSGQFEDDYSPAYQILFDDHPVVSKNEVDKPLNNKSENKSKK